MLSYLRIRCHRLVSSEVVLSLGSGGCPQEHFDKRRPRSIITDKATDQGEAIVVYTERCDIQNPTNMHIDGAQGNGNERDSYLVSWGATCGER